MLGAPAGCGCRSLRSPERERELPLAFLLTMQHPRPTPSSRLTKLQNSRQLLPAAPLPRLTFE